jgi:hypothetical protein
MNHNDDNLEVIPMEGGWVGFRAFAYDPTRVGACLMSVFAGYHWEPGPQQADDAPTMFNTNGFYAFYTLPEAILQFGLHVGHIFAMTEHWGIRQKDTKGMRTEWAELAAIIGPLRPELRETFPREALARDYPDVPIIHQRDILKVIFEKGMQPVLREDPASPAQWISPDGVLNWYYEGMGPDGDGWEELPAASTYPHRTHPADQRLRKFYFRDLRGPRYVFWDNGEGFGMDQLSLMLSVLPESSMYRHLDPG